MDQRGYRNVPCLSPAIYILSLFVITFWILLLLYLLDLKGHYSACHGYILLHFLDFPIFIHTL